MPHEQTGLMIIRAWLEPGSSKPLRAHIRLSTDIGDGFEREMTLADAPAVSAAVELWLQDVLLNGGPAPEMVIPKR
jgi:hypothetical protein